VGFHLDWNAWWFRDGAALLFGSELSVRAGSCVSRAYEGAHKVAQRFDTRFQGWVLTRLDLAPPL
jgi:hypothetical protein